VWVKFKVLKYHSNIGTDSREVAGVAQADTIKQNVTPGEILKPVDAP
jgi:hypothetical protein